jgi:nucleotide-binding universal stress UspA family protein
MFSPTLFTRILLAVDGTESDEVAASFIAGMASHGGATVRVLHVNEYLVGGRGFARSTPRESQKIVDDVARSLVVTGVPAEGEVRLAYSFDIASRIVDAANDWSADVIVFGSRRRHGAGLLRRVRGQGIREQVTDLTSLPTLTAPSPLKVGRRSRVEFEPLDPSLPEGVPSGIN